MRMYDCALEIGRNSGGALKCIEFCKTNPVSLLPCRLAAVFVRAPCGSKFVRTLIQGL